MSGIRKVILDGNFSSAIPVVPGTPRNALRLAIHSLASPSWQSKSPHVREETQKKQIFWFEYKLIYLIGFI